MLVQDPCHYLHHHHHVARVTIDIGRDGEKEWNRVELKGPLEYNQRFLVSKNWSLPFYFGGPRELDHRRFPHSVIF